MGVNWGRHTVTGLGNQGGSQNNPTAWDTIGFDGASYYDGAMSSAAGVFLRVENTATGQDLAFGARMTGSSDVLYRDVRRASQFDLFVGVNASGQADIAVETAASFIVTVLAWLGNDVSFSNQNSQSLGSVGTVDVYEDETVTYAAGTAVVAFGQYDGGGAANTNYHAKRQNIADGTFDRPETVFRNGYFQSGLTGSEALKWRCSSTTPLLRVMGGLHSADVTAIDPPNNVNSGLSDNTYGTIVTSAGIDAVGVAVMNASGVGAAHSWAIRDSVDTGVDDVGDLNRERCSAFGKKTTGVVQLKLEDGSDMEAWRVWELTNPSGGSGAAITAAAEAGMSMGAGVAAAAAFTAAVTSSDGQANAAAAVADVLAAGDAAAVMGAVIAASDALLAGVNAGEAWAGEVVAAAAMSAGGTADAVLAGVSAAGASGALAAGTDAGAAYATAVAALAGMTGAATADEASAGLVTALAALAAGSTADAVLAAVSTFGASGSFAAGADAGATHATAVATLGGMTGAATADDASAGLVTALAALAAVATAGAVFSHGGTLGHLVATIRARAAVTATATGRPAVTATATGRPAVTGTPTINE